MSWLSRSLDELGSVARGRSRYRPRDAAHLYGGPYPFVQTADVKAANLYLTEYEQTYSEAGLEQSKLWPRGTLCITIAANIAETAILGIEACFPDSVIGFIPEEDRADARFVKYMFDAVLKMQCRAYTQGAAQDNLSQAKLLTLKFPVPDIAEQRRIADVLSSYDDLIENHRRRMALLEEAARQLYREWFVRLRFPGHEHTRIIDGVPDGWELVQISELCSYLGRGISPRYDDEGAYVVINQKCIRNRLLSLDPGRRQSKEFKSERAVQHLDVLINSTGAGTLGRVAQCWITPENTTVDSHVTIARPLSEVSPLWFGYAVMETQPLLEQMGEGATNQKELSKGRIGAVRILLPPAALRVQFSDVAAGIARQVTLLSEQSARLRTARDLILPRLMNGEIAV